MNIDKIKLGDKAPQEFNAIIEIAKNSDPIKYEFDKDSGAIIVDRFMNTSMRYPCNYAFIPHTLGNDGDPVDVLVLCDLPLIPGSVIQVRAIGALIMEDESGMDEKILAVPTTKISKAYDSIISYQDVGEIELNKIKHFFERYKDLDSNKWVKVKGFEETEVAHKVIQDGIANHKKC